MEGSYTALYTICCYFTKLLVQLEYQNIFGPTRISNEAERQASLLTATGGVPTQTVLKTRCVDWFNFVNLIHKNMFSLNHDCLRFYWPCIVTCQNPKAKKRCCASKRIFGQIKICLNSQRKSLSCLNLNMFLCINQ